MTRKMIRLWLFDNNLFDGACFDHEDEEEAPRGLAESADDKLNSFGKPVHSAGDWPPVRPAHDEGREDISFVEVGFDDLLPSGKFEACLPPFEKPDSERDAQKWAKNELVEQDFFDY